MYISRNEFHLKEKEVTVALQLWNRSSVSLLDIRHNLISPEESVENYRLPANTFLYTSGGKAKITMNNTAYTVDRFGLFHGSKGTIVSITPHCDWLEYYTVLYKAVEPPLHKSEYQRLMEQTNPFRQQYGFAPHNPIFFSEELRKLYEKWKEPNPLNAFYSKAAFYRFVYEIYEELAGGDVCIFEPDVIAMAEQYINEHYSETVSIQTMCDILGISYSHFHRIFKQRTGKSPQDYLIQTRLSAAQKLLKNSKVTVREVAGYCGFQDERNFQRQFLKHIGVSPNAYRENTPLYVRGDTVGKPIPFLYNEEGQVSLGELKEKGATIMFKQIRGKAVIAAALSLMLMLSACGTAPASSTGTSSNPASAITSQVSDTSQKSQPVKEGTRTVKMEYGDVEIPMDPQRVVVIFVQGDLLSLGVTPVGTSFNEGSAFADISQNITEIDAFSINEEEILALNPDLIIWTAYDEQTYQSLSKIAPTLQKDFYNMEYRERLRFFGEIFNRSDKAEELIQNFEQKLATAKTKLSDANLMDKNFVCGDIRDGFMRLFEGGRGGSLVYGLLGLPAPEKLQSVFNTAEFQEKSFIDLSYEVLPEYIGDYILLNSSAEKVADNEVWKNLPAVKEGRLIQASSNMFWFNDILSLSKQLDLVVDGMLKTQN